MKHLKKKTDKTHLLQFQLLIFCKPAWSGKNFHGRLLSTRTFSADGHYLTIRQVTRYGLIAHEAKPNGLWTRGP